MEIYLVAGILGIIWASLFFYLKRLEARVSELEKEGKESHE